MLKESIDEFPPLANYIDRYLLILFLMFLMRYFIFLDEYISDLNFFT